MEPIRHMTMEETEEATRDLQPLLTAVAEAEEIFELDDLEAYAAKWRREHGL